MGRMVLRNITNEVFGTAVDLHSIPAGPALIYMIRRFGYSESGTDDYKRLCNYVLPTRIGGLYLGISFSATSCWIDDLMDDEAGYRYQEAESKARPYDIDHIFPGDTLIGQYQQALKEATQDLLRPVFIRDVPINILGRAENVEWDEEKEECSNCVERHFSSGYGVVVDAYREADTYIDMMHEIKEFGEGDIVVGMRRARELIATIQDSNLTPAI
jgi:hypothetical protein